MTEPEPPDVAQGNWDEEGVSRAKEHDFDRVVARAVSRRGFLGGALAFGSVAALTGAASRQATPAIAQDDPRFPFTPVPTATDNTVHVPEGWNWKVLLRWGDPLFDGVAEFEHAIGGAAADADKVFGENTDGMDSFVIAGRQILAINNEFVNRRLNLPHADDGKPRSVSDVRKLQGLQGVTIVEIAEGTDGWAVVSSSPFNRRITQNTPTLLAGPAAGHDLMKTEADPAGAMVRGTAANCGSGRTPWGTYLTCEENFNTYFGTSDDDQPAGLAETNLRYGISGGSAYGYERFDPRFDFRRNPNEPHRFGWVVEIDPSDPASTPVKHTGLGRFKHENAELVLARDGRVVIYMGDDAPGEFIYRFVSDAAYVPGGPTDGLLDQGTLYAARFDDDGTGIWVPLTPETTGMDDVGILVFTRLAGSAAGATTMDRPEWVAANPFAVEAYCCLSNNTERGVAPNAGGDPTPASGPNPREANPYGQVVRWYPHGGDHAADTFDWDLYVIAGNPTVHADAYAGSSNINPGNMFSAPDQISFDSTGLLWIRTDGKDDNEGDYAGIGNNQTVVGDPVTGEIARFMTGPKGCEVTGLTWSADRRTMFVGIMHPGGTWPDGRAPARSSVIAIKRDDGGVVG